MTRSPFLSESWYRVAGVRASLRSDLRVARQLFRKRAWYVIHDPVSRQNHRLTPEAWFFLARLDGTRPIDAVWKETAAELGDQALGQTEILELLGRLAAAELIRTDRNPDLGRLIERRQRQHKPLWIKNLLSPLSVRIPIWDCDHFLMRVTPWLRPFLGRTGWLVWFLWVLPAAWLALQYGRELTDNLSDRLLAPQNLLLLAVVFPVVKFIHELAHGVAVKANGGAVHEMGLMFLVLAPVPYVDASSASAIRSKWERAFVGFAGMWAELAVASGAMYLWLLLEPGTTRSIMHDVMLIAGISTVVFNGNPLLRFDGYYVLCDLIEIPNLASRSNEYWLLVLRKYVLGEKRLVRPEYAAGERGWYFAYAPLSLVYRLSVAIGIALFVSQQYFFVGVALAIVAVASAVLVPISRGVIYLLSAQTLADVRGRALLGSGAVIAGLVGLLFFVPLPHWVAAEGLLWVPSCAELRAPENGTLLDPVRNGLKMVDAGTPVVRLTNQELETELLAQKARVRQLDIQLQLELARDRTKAAITMEESDQEIRVLRRLEERVASLAITSCISGEVQLNRAEDMDGAYVNRGDLLGHVRSGTHNIIRVVVGQDDIGLVRLASPQANVMLADRIGSEVTARFVREVPGGEFKLPAAALGVDGGGAHAVDPSDSERLKTLNRVFQLDVEVDGEIPGSRVGTRAYVKFQLPSEPASTQISRRVRQLFLARFSV